MVTYNLLCIGSLDCFWKLWQLSSKFTFKGIKKARQLWQISLHTTCILLAYYWYYAFAYYRKLWRLLGWKLWRLLPWQLSDWKLWQLSHSKTLSTFTHILFGCLFLSLSAPFELSTFPHFAFLCSFFVVFVLVLACLFLYMLFKAVLLPFACV